MNPVAERVQIPAAVPNIFKSPETVRPLCEIEKIDQGTI
jgi:hypothetical protein